MLPLQKLALSWILLGFASRALAGDGLPEYEICRSTSEGETCVRSWSSCAEGKIELRSMRGRSPCVTEGAEACQAFHEFLEITATQLSSAGEDPKRLPRSCDGWSLIVPSGVYTVCLGSRPKAEDALFRTYRHARGLCE